MLKIVSSNPILIEFLSKYPDSLHQACTEAIIVYGIRTLKSKFPYGLTAPQLLSVSGLSHPPHPSSSMSYSNRSIDLNFHSIREDLSKNDEKTERFQQTRWQSSNPKMMSRLSSEKQLNISSKLKEPQTAPYDAAKVLLKSKVSESFDTENEVMKIADSFLKNNYLSNGFRG